MKFDYDLVIIGAGSAGIAAAEMAPRMGVRALLVERDRIGGDCLWTGCVPSKALIASARLAHRMRHADELGLRPTTGYPRTEDVLARIRSVQERIAAAEDSAERLTALGTEVVYGEARLVGAHTVHVNGRQFATRYILIATGSRPSVPPIDGLAGAGFLTTDTLFRLDRLPPSIVCIGGGPVAIELAQAMNRLGADVAVLERLPQILDREEPALRERIHRVLTGEGVSIHAGVDLTGTQRRGGAKVLSGVIGGESHEWAADEILVATGRTPNIEGLDFRQAGVRSDERGILVDSRLRTSVPSIYAAGDVAGRYQFTHSAAHEAVIALRNMFYPGSRPVAATTPWTTFTDPELGHAGMTSAEALAAYGEDGVLVFRHPLERSDRARAEAEDTGEVVLITDRKYRIVGAHVLAPGAGEMMGLLAAAIERRDRLTPDLANAIQVYPTMAFSLSQLAGQAIYRQLDRPFLRAVRRLASVFG